MCIIPVVFGPFHTKLLCRRKKRKQISGRLLKKAI